MTVENRTYRCDSLALRHMLLTSSIDNILNSPPIYQREEIIRQWHEPSAVLFSDYRNPRLIQRILKFAREHAVTADRLTGLRLMIVGMPNVGKSSLLNALRQVGMHKGKAARTGAQPGVTRKVGTTVKIIEATDEREGVYLLDTPGVFVPYVPDAESMLKLALCGSVKDTIIAPVNLADYLLYQLNLNQPSLYDDYSAPTNDIMFLLEAVARKIGRLQKGGIPDFEASALWLVQRWRTSHFGKFLLDEISDRSLAEGRRKLDGLNKSISQARRSERDTRRQNTKQRQISIR